MGVSPWIPDLDGPVFAASNEPLALVVERDCGDVGSVALERNQLNRANMRGGRIMGIRDRIGSLREWKRSFRPHRY